MNAMLANYLVLNPAGDDEYAKAARIAIRVYAANIRDKHPAIAGDIDKWVDTFTNLYIRAEQERIKREPRDC